MKIGDDKEILKLHKEGMFLRELSVYKIASTPAVATFACHKCGKSYPVPVMEKGKFYCKKCGNNVSKQFVAFLIADDIKFELDRNYRNFSIKSKREPIVKPYNNLKQKNIIEHEPKQKPLSIRERKAIKNLLRG